MNADQPTETTAPQAPQPPAHSEGAGLSAVLGSVTAMPGDMQIRWWCWLLSRDGEEGQPWEYILWITERWREWAKDAERHQPWTIEDHSQFDEWLASRACPSCHVTGYVPDRDNPGEVCMCGFCTAHGFRSPNIERREPRTSHE